LVLLKELARHKTADTTLRVYNKGISEKGFEAGMRAFQKTLGQLSLNLSSLPVLLLSHWHVINNKELTQAVLTRHSPYGDRIEKRGLGVIRFLTAVWTLEPENSVRH
jgi:hypothetical protein